MSMRNEMNNALGIKPNMSHMHNSSLEKIMDDAPLSIMGQEQRRFPPADTIEWKKAKLIPVIQKLFDDEVEAISAYERAEHNVKDNNIDPHIGYLFSVIADEERNHRRILQEIQASILQTKTHEIAGGNLGKRATVISVNKEGIIIGRSPSGQYKLYMDDGTSIYADRTDVRIGD